MARLMALAGHSGRKLNPDAFVNSEPDDDDEDGQDLLDSLAGSLGCDGRKLRASLLAGVQTQAALSEDGKVLRFQDNANAATEVQALTLSNSTAVNLGVFTADSGYYVESIEFDTDGIGSNDNATVRLVVSGHQPVAEVFLLGSEGMTVKWGRPLTTSHVFTVTAPHAAVGKEVAVFVAARGIVPSTEAIRAHAKAYRQGAPENERKALARTRNKSTTRATSTVARAIGSGGAARGLSVGSGGGFGVGRGPAAGLGGGGIRGRLGK